MPRAVTLASVILRFIIATQATICTSMIAALLLERLAVPRSQAARASVMRAINDGPLKLVMLVLSYQGKASYMLWHPETWLIVLIALLSIALQFTSTILLSDMHSFVMIGDHNTTTAKSLFAYPKDGEFLFSQGNVMADTPVFPVFGEAPISHDSSPDSRGFSDTGLKQRGLLPMSDSGTRTSVREYDGMGMVMSSRVACMRPVITNASVDIVEETFGRMQGVLDYGQSLEQARPGTETLCSSSEKCKRLGFECTMPAADNATGSWAAMGCMVDGVGGNIRGPSQPSWDPETGPWSENSSVWLVYSTNMGVEQWESQSPSFSMPTGLPLGNSEWTIYEISPGYFIKLAVCFSAFNFAYQDIYMTASAATAELSMPWSVVLKEETNLDDAKTYLGLNSSLQAVGDRGLLDLKIKHDKSSDTPYTPPPPFDDLLNLPEDEISPSFLTVDTLQMELDLELSGGNMRNATFNLCQRCNSLGVIVHMGYSTLFSGILSGEFQDFGAAANALHAIISVTGVNVYDQLLANTMDVAEEVRVVATRMVTVAGSWPPSTAECAGFIAVASLLAVYLALVAVITVLYIRRTRYSRYANVWHVISQLMASEELKETLELGNNASDKAVAMGLRTEGSTQEDVLVKLGMTDGCEKIKVRKF